MAAERQRSEWARAGVVAAAARSAFGGGFDPLLFVPPAFRPPPAPPRPRTAEEADAESRIGWAVLRRGLGRGGG